MPVQTALAPQGQSQKKSVAFTSGASSNLGQFATATMVELYATANCRIAIGESGDSADALDKLILAGMPYLIGISKGDYIHVIGDTGSGTLEGYPVNVS